MTLDQLALQLILGVALGISLWSDLRHRRILDAVTLPAILGSLVVRWWSGGTGTWEEGGLVSGLLGAAAAGLVFGGAAVVTREVGWGDVKLLVAVGANLGVPLVLTALVAISLVGAAQGLGVVLWRARAQRGATNSGASPRHIPYGVAITVGTAWAVWSAARF